MLHAHKGIVHRSLCFEDPDNAAQPRSIPDLVGAWEMATITKKCEIYGIWDTLLSF